MPMFEHNFMKGTIKGTPILMAHQKNIPSVLNGTLTGKNEYIIWYILLRQNPHKFEQKRRLTHLSFIS